MALDEDHVVVALADRERRAAVIVGRTEGDPTRAGVPDAVEKV
jgi:hypothetical protein